MPSMRALSVPMISGLLAMTLVALPASKPVVKSSRAQSQRPKLVLVISVDQFSADLLQRYCKDLPGGLGLLQKRGVNFTEAYHDHAFTETGPGHSVLLSGRFPGHTGIVENTWYDRAVGRNVYCVDDDGAHPVGQPERMGASPARFVGTTLGDWLQAQVKGSRAFSISGKDRAAILMAGRKPTAAYWFDGANGFNTSTAYAGALPTWLVAYDDQLLNRFLRDDWTWIPLGPVNGQGRVATWTIQGQTVRDGAFPHLVTSAGMPLDKGFETRFRKTPFLDDVTLEATEIMMEKEKIGRGPSTDLLTLSLSATDYVGHMYGPGSAEMWDHLHRLDKRLGAFLSWVRKRNPEAWIVLTADHGGLDLPEGLKDDGISANRLDPKTWTASLNAALRDRLHVDVDLVRPSADPKQLYFDEKVLMDSGLDRTKALEAMMVQIKSLPEVELVASKEELAAYDEGSLGNPRDTSIFTRLKHSFMLERSGDVLVAFKPLTIFSGVPYVATHGSPWDYDRRVPIIFLGPWKARKVTEPVRTVDIAPTLAKELRIVPSEPLDGKALALESQSEK